MDADARKTVLRLIPYGLYVLTSEAEGSTASGTVNWVTQASFEPPLLAIGVKQGTLSLANIEASGSLALSFLGPDQGNLAFAFFGDADVEGDEFVTKDARVPFERTPGGAIVLRDAPGWAELKARETVLIGDHAVVVAEVVDVGQHVEQPEILTLKSLGLNYGG
ncbi:MAG: flavin reductase family protein [Dehalococcoidia bacterium]